MTFKEHAKKLKQNIPTVFLALKDKDTPVLAKVCAVVTIGYALSPVDLIPDFIPFLGYLDDMIILPALVALTIKLIPENVWERNSRASKDLWKEGRPKKWYFAIPIVFIWAVVAIFIIRTLLF